MKNLRIATWNIKNSYFNLRKNEMKATAIIQLLKEEKVDILTLQEVNPLLARKIEEKLNALKSDYQITTSYEKLKNPIKNLRIEYNMIISKLQPTLEEYTLDLPSIPKGIKKFKLWELRKRNIVTQSFPDKLVIDTTHLDHTSEELGKRQMDEVISFMKPQSNIGLDVVLTGNLNRKPTEQNMIDFTNQLSDIGMKVIENPNKTYIGHTDNQPVDYIIVPDSWEVESIKTLENYDDISSHRPVVAETRKK